MGKTMKQQDLFSDFTFDTPKAVSTKDDAFLNAYSIVLESNVVQDEYTKYIQDNFDLKISNTCSVIVPNKINIANLKGWNIIVICGASGSGKTTILKHLAESNGSSLTKPMFDNTKSLISNFDNLQPCDAAMLLSSMGLASVPTWIRPYNVCRMANNIVRR
jgi:ABC-type glutathione transport system ATPase component